MVMFNIKIIYSKIKCHFTDNITSQLGCIASDNFIYENKTQSVAIRLDEFNVFLNLSFCSKV